MTTTVILTNVGYSVAANRIKGNGTEPKYVGWGTGAGTAAVGDTTLFTEGAESRTTGTSTIVTTTQTNDTYQVAGTVTSLSGQTITNAGLFDASISGNLFVHASFTGIALATNESIAFTFQLQIT